MRDLYNHYINNNAIDRYRQSTWGISPQKSAKAHIRALLLSRRITGRGITYQFQGSSGVYTHSTKSVASVYDVYRQVLRLPDEAIQNLTD